MFIIPTRHVALPVRDASVAPHIGKCLTGPLTP
jgi:hypothetical protein